MRIDKSSAISLLSNLITWGIYLFCVSIPFSIAGSQIGIITALVAWLILALAKKELLWKNNIMTLPIAFFLATQLLSVFFSIDIFRSIHEFRSYWHILIFFLIVNCCGKEIMKRGLLLIAGSTSAASLLGVGQYVCSRYIVGGLAAQHRVSGSMGMYMTYSGILMIVAILVLAMVLYAGFQKKAKITLAAVFLLIAAALICTLTRSAWIGFVAGTAAIGVVKDRRLLIYLILGIAVASFMAPKDARERFMRMLKGHTTIVQDGAVVSQRDERPHLWKAGIKVMLNNPMTGVGLKNFRKAYPQYLAYTPKKNFNHAHNNFIHIGAETGVTGLIAFLYMIGAYLYYIFGRVRKVSIREKSFESAAVIGVTGAFLAFLTAGLFEYNFGDSEVAMLVWFLMAVCAA